MHKKIYYTGFIAYLAMAILAVLFFKERTILSDTAYNLFYIAKDGKLAIQSFRFGDSFTQGCAVIARNLALSLKGLMISYSLSFILYYFICYVLAGLVFGQFRLALVMLLTEVLFTTHTFYYEVSPLLQGIVYLLLVLSVIAFLQQRRFKYTNVIASPLIVFSVFFHPLMLVVTVFTLGYFWLSEDKWFSRKSIMFVAVVFAASLVLKSLFFRVAYETHSLGGLRNFLKLFPDYFTIYSNRRFLSNCISSYIFVPVALASIIWSYKKQESWRILLFVTAAFAGYVMLVNICYPSAAIPDFYVENLYMPLALMLSLPFVFDVLPELKPAIAASFVSVILLVAMGRFYTTHYLYSDRLAYERKIVRKYGDKKVVLRATVSDKQVIQMLWGTPYEFWALSTLESGNTASIIIDEDPHARDWAWTLNKSMVVNWNVFPYSQLPARYFHFTDTTNGYHTID